MCYGDAINVSKLWDSLRFSPLLSRIPDLLTGRLREDTCVNPFIKHELKLDFCFVVDKNKSKLEYFLILLKSIVLHIYQVQRLHFRAH